MPEVDLGKVTGDKGVSIRNRGDWNNTAKYVNDSQFIDVVTYEGNLWMCAVTNTNVEPGKEKTQWNLMVEGLSSIVFTQATTRENIKTGETTSVSFGKISKWFADLKAAAFLGVVNNLTTTVAGSVLDARQGKELKRMIDDTDEKTQELKDCTYKKGYVKAAISDWSLKTSYVNIGVENTDITEDNPYMEAVMGNNGGIRIKQDGLYHVMLKNPSMHLSASTDGSQVGWCAICKNNVTDASNQLVVVSSYVFWTKEFVNINPTCSTVVELKAGDLIVGALSKSEVNAYNLYSRGGAVLEVTKLF